MNINQNQVTSFDELVAVIKRNFGSLTPSQQLLARWVVSDPEGCAFLTVTEMADRAGINASTVVRFATALGLSGFPELISLCRSRLKTRQLFVNRFDTLDAVAVGSGGARERALAFDQVNLANTFNAVNTSDWQRSVGLLAKSDRIYIMGMRKLYTVAYLFHYILSLTRENVISVNSFAGTAPDQLRRIGTGQVFVGIGIHRYTRETVQAMNFAKRRGAATIALTDVPVSPLAQLADVSLYSDTASGSILRSCTAFISLVQALAADVQSSLGESTRSSLLMEEELLQDFDMYSDDPNPVGRRGRSANADGA